MSFLFTVLKYTEIHTRDGNNPTRVQSIPNAKDDIHRIREIFMVSDQFA